MGKEKVIDLPFQCVAVELVGSFPRSNKGHKWLLVVEDWFTKYILLFPLRSSKSRNSHRKDFGGANFSCFWLYPDFNL